MCCNPAKGRVEFEDVWLINPASLLRKDEMKACQLTRMKIQQKKVSCSYLMPVSELEVD